MTLKSFIIMQGFHMKSSGTKGRILIVDDTPLNVSLLGDMLRRRHYEVLEANDGYQALEIVAQRSPELILLDINMPMMSGYEVCQRLKADPQTKDIPVIFISALNDVQDIVKAFEVGGVDYIVKPFQVREVMARVDGQLTIYRQRREIDTLRQREVQQYALLDELRRQFIGSATHDLKNPLALINGYVYLLETHPKIQDDAEIQGYLETIKRASRKMGHLVGDMLDLLKMEVGITLEISEFDLSALVRQQASDQELAARDKQQRYTVIVPDQPIMLQADANRLSRVVDNLVSNAIKYTRRGGEVSVALSLMDGQAVLEVRDNGLGIPTEALDRLFEPFYRVNTIEHRAVEGTGLGLSIVKSIVEAHGGSIEVESQLGQGSTFRVFLPLKTTQAGTA
ncbi:MAG: hybrid sensor histidine kinase/response regulator [Anaerolineae bacterium]|nr:hybrid sensor histidine kinase/response regulator [Anaerolineae bacterium]